MEPNPSLVMPKMVKLKTSIKMCAIMKKVLFMIGAVLMAGCTKTETDNSAIAPAKERVEVGVATTTTKATFDSSLKAYWESGDRIAALFGYGNARGEMLDMQSGADAANAVFAGEIAVNDLVNNHYVHFAYPDTAVLESVGEAESTTTCTFTVASEQDGKWTPFLCASSAEPTRPSAVTSVAFGTSLNAAFGVRVFAADGTTPKKLQSVSITAENNITGTLSATTATDGSFADVAFVANATGNTITATNPQYTEGVDGKGRTYYEYRFEVMPVDAGLITITLTAEDGAILSRTTGKAVAFTANKRNGANITWASVSFDSITSWFEDSCNTGSLSALDGRKIYVNNVRIAGVDSDAAGVSESGVRVTDADGNVSLYKNDKGGTTFSKEIAVVGGKYKVQPYAIINGVEYTASEQEIFVTSVLGVGNHTIWTSYNRNAAVSKQNSGVDNDKIYANVALSGDDAAYAQANLVSAVSLVYGSGATALKSGDRSLMGTDFATDGIAKQQYPSCRVRVSLANAAGKSFTLESTAYTMNVTGIPYTITTNKSTPDGWSTSNTTTSYGHLLIEDGGYAQSPTFYASATCTYATKVTTDVYMYKGSLISATYTLTIQTVPGSTLLNENLSGGVGTSDSDSKYVYPTFSSPTSVKISTKKVKKSGGSLINYGMRIHKFVVEYN